MELLLATSVHLHFKLPVVAYLCQQDSKAVNEVRGCLVEELVDRVKEPEMLDFKETAQADAYETDFMYVCGR